MAVPDAPSMQARDKPIEKLPLEPAASAHPPHVRVNASPVTPNDEISQLLKAPPVQRPLAAPPVRPATTKVPPAAPKKSVMAAQRALVTLGFVLNPDGIAGKTTRQAVERYERDRGLPVRGDLTPALMRRLSSETGVAH